MKAAWRVVSTAVAATSAFEIIAGTFQCCEGENGFARNVSITSFVALGLFLVALVLHADHRRRPLVFGAIVVAWSLAIAAIVLSARPPWEAYVFGRALHLNTRAMLVFTATAFVEYLLFLVISRLSLRTH